MKTESHGSVNIGRRKLLKASAAGTLLAVTPLTPVWATSERRLSLRNLHTGESIDQVYWQQGEYLKDSLSEFNQVLRDHRSGEVYPIDTSLLDMLFDLQQSTGARGEYHVISGYRSPATNAALHKKSNGVAKRSLHMQGRAIDVRMPKVELARLHKAALTLQSGGVGLYTRSDFIHVDTGRVRNW